MNNAINNFSPNMLKTFDECQRKFFLKYIQRLVVPQRSTLFEKGKKIHALANYYLKGDNVEKMEKVLTPDEKIAWESLKSNKYFTRQVVNTEYNLSCKIGNYWVGGRLDALMTGDGKGKRENQNENEEPLNHSSYFILDYKTGNIPQNAEQDFQTIIYLLCADKFLNKKGAYEALKFVYLGLKNNIEKEILLNETLKKQYEEKIVSTCEKINFTINSNVFLKNNEACKYCEYCKICK
ncbi:MAG: PD-(D/E)XK nuclease family protein [bacterium]